MRLARPLLLAALFASALSSLAAAHDPAAQAKYLGNEGVLIVRGKTKIVFDAFYAESFGIYAMVPTDIASAMMAGEPPYDGVDAVFVSHAHGDHFAAGPVIAYLRAHEQVRLYAPLQVAALIAAEAKDAADPMLARVTAIDVAPGAPSRTLSVGAIEIDAYAIPHSGGARTADVENIAFRVTLDGETTVMHFGDADTADRHFAPYQKDFDRRQVDAALPPYWFLLDPEGRLVLERRIRADHVIGVHVPVEETGRDDAARAEAGGDLFTNPGEIRDIGGH